MNYLLDTNTVIYLLNDRLATALPAGRHGVSVITEIELLSFPGLQPDEEQRIRAFLAAADRVAITDAVRDQTVALRRLYRLKLRMRSSRLAQSLKMPCCSVMTAS